MIRKWFPAAAVALGSFSFLGQSRHFLLWQQQQQQKSKAAPSSATMEEGGFGLTPRKVIVEGEDGSGPSSSSDAAVDLTIHVDDRDDTNSNNTTTNTTNIAGTVSTGTTSGTPGLQPQHWRQRLSRLDDFNYTWLGNRFNPPRGVPQYTMEDYLEAFQRHSVLWMGDSTMRRAYLTAQILMNQTQGDARGEDLVKWRTEAFRVLNVNTGSTGVQEHCPSIGSYNWTSAGNGTTAAGGAIFTGRTVYNTLLCRGTPGSPQRNDYAYFPCFERIRDFADLDFGRNRSTTKDYDFLVVGAGIWDALKLPKCRPRGSGGADYDPLQLLNVTIDAVARLASPQFRVLWRTPGFGKPGEAEDELLQVGRIIKERLNGEKYVHVIDWGSVVHRRSFGADRAPNSDGISFHYGLEARLLFLNMLLQTMHNVDVEMRMVEESEEVDS